jgi:polysaccharide chain length determinant protein (PEP-CTERM system associated)
MLLGKRYTIVDYGRAAWRRRWFIAVPFGACVLATLVYSSRLPNVYQSEMMIQIVPQRVPESYVQSTVTMRTEDRLSALSQQVMSRTQLEKLIGDLNLYPNDRARLPMEDVVEEMRQAIDVDPVRSMRDGRPDVDSFRVRFKYFDPQIAMQVTSHLGSLFIDQNARDRGGLAEATNDFLGLQLKEARERLEAEERRLEQFREQHAGQLPSQMTFNMQAIQNSEMQLQALNESLARDRDRKLMLERLYADAQGASGAATQPGDPLPVAWTTAQQQLAGARSALEALEVTKKPDHPDVIRAKRVIRELEKKAEQETSNDSTASASVAVTPDQLGRREKLQGMRAEIESLDRQIAFKENEEAKLKLAVEGYQKRIEATPGMESEWTALTRDYDTQLAAYKTLLANSDRARISVDLERRQIGEQFRILDRPRVPVRPISPLRRQISLAGAGIGLMLGLAMAALLELRDSTFKVESEVVEVLSLPVLAVVPYLESETDRLKRRYRQLLVSGSLTLAAGAGCYVIWVMKLWRYVA